MKLKRLLGWDSLVLLFIVGMLIGPSVVPGWDLDTIRRVGGGREIPASAAFPWFYYGFFSLIAVYVVSRKIWPDEGDE